MSVLQGGRILPPCLFLLCGIAASLHADDMADEAELNQARSLETVQVTATRTEQSIHDVSEAVSVVTADEIDRQAPELLAEMLRGVPGAFFQQTTPGQGIPIIRGLKGSQVLHLVDGMRLNNAFFRNAPNQYLGLVDAFATERLEVVRGSAPSLYGADAMGGVVQVLTAEPELSGPQWHADGRIYGSFDSADSGVVARAQAAAGKDGVAISGGVTYQDHSNRETGGGILVSPSAYRVKAADFKWRRKFGANSELMLSAQYLQQPSTPRVDELVPGYGQDHPSSDQYEFQPNQRGFLHARYRLDSDARWFSSFEAHLARQVMQMGREGHQIDVHRQKHQFYRHQDDDDVLAVQENPEQPQREQGGGDCQVMSKSDLQHHTPLPVGTLTSSTVSFERRAVWSATRWRRTSR